MILPLTGVAQPAAGQDGMMRPRGEGMGMGTGLAIGIGTSLLIDQLSKPGGANENKKVDKKTEKKVAKQPPPKKDKPQNAKAPETPPAKQADNPLQPTATPIPPVAGPPSLPPTTDNPLNKTGSPPERNDVPPTQTVSSPPDQPKTPGVPPEDPHDIPVPPTIYGYNKDEDCPQRGMGCAALIIDFQTHYLGDLEPLKEHLAANKGCEVEYVTPQFLSGKELATANDKLNKNTKSGEPHRNVNDFEWKRVDEAIARHRQKVLNGVELAIEVLRGEGYPAELRSCGSVGPAEGRSLDRQAFHAGNYQAANKHVCGWVVTDFSCYSGYTPHVFDELNNRGSLPRKEVKVSEGVTEFRERACQPAQANDCSQHAAYDFDIAMGQSGSSLPACALFTPALRDSLKGALLRKGNKIEFSMDKAKRVLGFEPAHSLEDSVLAIKEWIEAGGLEVDNITTSKKFGSGVKTAATPA